MSRLEAWAKLDGPASAPVVEAEPVEPAAPQLPPVPVPAERPHAPVLESLLSRDPHGPDAAYLAGVGERLALADEPARAMALEGPWSFKAWLVGAEGVADGGERPARNRLLHALFPGTFEPITAPEEKHAIAGALGSLADDDDRHDVDRTLFAVRARLEQLVARGEISLPGGVDFYGHPLRETWDAGELGRSAVLSGLSHLDALRHKKQVVLYGPPGTGKTFEAKALADRLIRNEAIRLWGPVEYIRNRERVAELVRRQVRRRQLHQAYSYEDFVIGLRVAENGETEPYRGDLLQLIDEIRQTRVTSMDPEPLPWVLILDEINRTDLSRLLGEAFSALDDREAQIDLPAVGGHPVDPFKLPEDLYLVGTMNTIDQSVEQLDFAMRRRFFWLHSGFRGHVIPIVVRARWEALDHAIRPWLAGHPWEALEPEIARLADHAAALNRAVASSPLLGVDYEIGHTYFFDVVGFIADQPRLRSSATAPGNYLWAADGRPTPALIDLWSHALEPLLADYLSGLDGGARDALLRELEAVFLASAETDAAGARLR
jgi:5-methylcytosine-specific restriction protein B